MINMNAPMRTEDFRRLLDELIAILKRENEQNWSRGVGAARASLDDPGGDRGCMETRSILNTMFQAKGGFSDYYIQRRNVAEQVEANRRLDEVRDELWRLLQP